MTDPHPITGPTQDFLLSLLPQDKLLPGVPKTYQLDLRAGSIISAFQPAMAQATFIEDFLTPFMRMEDIGATRSYHHRLRDRFMALDEMLFDRSRWQQSDIDFINRFWPTLWQTELGEAYGLAKKHTELTYQRGHLLLGPQIPSRGGMVPAVFEPYYYACHLVTEPEVAHQAETAAVTMGLSPMMRTYHEELFTLVRHVLLLDMPLT